MLLRLQRPARKLAQNAPRDLGAFREFSNFVTKALYCDVPQTKPLPSSDLDTPLNVAACALAALRACIKVMELSSCNSQTIEFVMQTLPYVAAWIGYFLQHIIIPGCDHGFPFNLAKLSSGIILQLLLCAKEFPLLHQELVSMKAIISHQKDPAPGFFLSSVVLALLHSSSFKLPEDSSCEYKLFLSSQGPKYQRQFRRIHTRAFKGVKQKRGME
ncbi:hypothetical protein CPB85DRAFT_1437965 [Mucidula mucida]|nr:hypothetical protein CPB85DRAFT_1437965 [Mucidula mucida]